MRFLIALLSMASLAANAQVLSTDKVYDEKLRGPQITALKGDLFGDQVSLKDGTVQFRQVDVSVPTNSGLKVEFARSTPRHKQGRDYAQQPLGMSWEIDAPYMLATFDTRRGWDTGGGARCSSSYLGPTQLVGPSPDYNTRVMVAYNYWSGIHINVPGQGFKNLLRLLPGQSVPQDGLTYIGAAEGFWRVACLPTIKNGSGEGFIVRLPDGTKYFFDWMATRNADDVLANESYRNSAGDGTDPTGLLVPTSDVFLYATKVEDRHGNTVAYNYDPTNKHRLTSIVSSDGARIDILYNSGGQVGEVHAGGKIWRYNYQQLLGSSLQEVVLPDQSKWTFGGVQMHWYRVPLTLPSSFYSNTCSQNATGYRSQDLTPANHLPVIMTHPSGARAEFRFGSIIHGSDNTPGGCDLFGTGIYNIYFGAYGVPSAYLASSLLTKTITGAGLGTMMWSYTYQPSWSFARDCSAGCRSRTTLVDPSGDSIEYVFGNSYTTDIGKLLQENTRRGGVLKRSINYAYQLTPAGYPASHGDILTGNNGVLELYGNPTTNRLMPELSRETIQDGSTFKATNSDFDGYARPRKIVRVGPGSGATTPSQPGLTAPTLSAPTTASAGTVFTVGWAAVATATSYVLERKNANQAAFVAIYTGANLSASVNAGLAAAGPVEVRVKACNAQGCSSYSPVKYVNITSSGGGGMEP